MNDKLKHFILSMTMTWVFFIILLHLNLINLWYIAPLVAFIIGIAKEVYDYTNKKGTADIWDIVANVFGITFSLFVIWILINF